MVRLRLITSLNAFPEIRPAERIQAISAGDFTARRECTYGARGVYRSSKLRKGKSRETCERNRGRGRISSAILPEIVGKETYIRFASVRRAGRSDAIFVLGRPSSAL